MDKFSRLLLLGIFVSLVAIAFIIGNKQIPVATFPSYLEVSNSESFEFISLGDNRILVSSFYPSSSDKGRFYVFEYNPEEGTFTPISSYDYYEDIMSAEW